MSSEKYSQLKEILGTKTYDKFLDGEKNKPAYQNQIQFPGNY